ncbi:hypothetical protein H8Z60_20075 [Mycolicibacterium fortuitum]|nr:hypothetical protein [Mycolicibacterium fortuitum]
MTDPIPEWLRQTPNLESLHNLPDVPWGGWNPREVPLPSLPELADIVQFFLDNFLGWVAKALGAIEILGWKPFEWLVEFGQQLQDRFSNLAALFGIEDTDLDGDIDVHDVWQTVVNTFIQPLLDLFDAIGDGINAILGPIFGGIDLKDPPTPGEVWQTVINTLMLPLNLLLGPGSALNAANLFGRIALPQLAGGVSIADLTTATANLLDPFSAESVPTADGWSFSASEGAAQVVADGSTKKLYLKSGVIKVEEGQPINTTIPVRYAGVTSGAGHTIRYEFETYTSEDGSGTATPVVVGFINNPSGTISSPVTVGDTSWDIPAGVQSIRPVLVVDELVTAGTVFWKNTPVLRKILLGVLADGIAAAIQARIDEFNDLLSDLLTNPAAVLGDIPRALVDGLEAWWDGITAKTVNLTSGGFFDAGKLQNITGTISQSLVTGLTSSLNTLNTFIQNVIDAILTALRGVPIIGGVIADIISDVTGLKETADNALSTADQIVEDTNAGWTGGTPSGTPTPVYDTITEIKNAVSGIYTMEVKTTSGTWTNPGGIVEFWVLCIGSGDGGSSGAGTASNLFAYGGDSGNTTTSTVGAAGGNYLAQQVNPADLTATVDYTVPAGGAGGLGPTSSPGTPGAAATFGSYASSETVQSASIASILGYYNADASAPGYGGPGGWKTSGGNDFAGKSGKSTPLATGGSFGSPGANGGAGGDASLTGQSRCGGGGGGGGGGNASGKGGNGGAGGFPGGAGGGGGGGLAGSGGGGNGGNGANGAIVLIYR